MWRLYPEEGCYDTRWLTGFWSTQAKVEGTVPKAAWHYGRDSSVVKNPFGNQVTPHCMLAFRLRGAPWAVTLRFPHMYVGGLFFGDSG